MCTEKGKRGLIQFKQGPLALPPMYNVLIKDLGTNLAGVVQFVS